MQYCTTSICSYMYVNKRRTHDCTEYTHVYTQCMLHDCTDCIYTCYCRCIYMYLYMHVLTCCQQCMQCAEEREIARSSGPPGSQRPPLSPAEPRCLSAADEPPSYPLPALPGRETAVAGGRGGGGSESQRINRKSF